MKLNKIVPELIVEDVDKTVNFYCGILKFVLAESFGNNPMRFARLKDSDGKTELLIMIKEDFQKELGDYSVGKTNGGALILIGMEDINNFYLKIKSKVRVLRELQKTDYNTIEFTIEDVNGYLVQFVERV